MLQSRTRGETAEGTRHQKRKGRLIVAATMAYAILMPGTAAAQAAGTVNSDCHALRLATASGVPDGQIRTYTFSGTCNIINVNTEGPSVIRTVPAEASATWDPAKKELSERFRVLAAFEGVAYPRVSGGTWGAPDAVYETPWQIKPLEVTSRFVCNDDPLVTNGACGLVAHTNLSGFAPFSNPATKESRPLLKGKTTMAEATTLSPTVVATTAAVTVHEAEGLGLFNRARVTSGSLTNQSMAGFGTGWGANHQLLWSVGVPGAELRLTFNVPASARYRVELFMTKAPDYGSVLLQLEGHNASASFDGYAANVMRSAAINVGEFDLPSGNQTLILKHLGKHISSKGFLVGVDQVRLVRVPW